VRQAVGAHVAGLASGSQASTSKTRTGNRFNAKEKAAEGSAAFFEYQF
jgi:hypothetical protein